MARLGALAALPDLAPQTTQVAEGGGAPLGAVVQPDINEQAPKNEDEYAQRVKRNTEWLQNPETQAALLQFAISIMQPVGGNGGMADFVGAVGRSVGEAAQAPARMREAEADQAREDMKLQMDQQELGLRARELGLKGQELDAKLKESKQRKVVRILDGRSALNKKYNLGIPTGQPTRVEIILDENGKDLSASVQDEFGQSEEEKAAATREEGRKDRTEARAIAAEGRGIAKDARDEQRAVAEDTRAANADQRAANADTRAQEEADRAAAEAERKANTSSIIIGPDSPLNEHFGLGLTGPTKVQVVKDKDGAYLSASVEQAPEQTQATEISRTLDEAQAAEDAGDTSRAAMLRSRAYQLSQEYSAASGTLLVPPNTGNAGIAPTTGGTKAEVETGVPLQKGTPTTQIQTPGAPAGMPQIVPIPGGKLDMEMAAAKEKEGQARMSDLQKGLLVMENTRQMREIINSAWMPDGTITGGLAAAIALLPMGSDARRVQNMFTTIKSNVGFDQLQAMRDASPTGGALGPVSDTENALLQSTITSLDQYQGKEQVLRNLKTIDFIFDPTILERKKELNLAIQNGVMTQIEGINAFNDMYRNYVFGPEENAPPPFDTKVAPSYVDDPYIVERWNKLTDVEKLDWLSDEDNAKLRNQLMQGPPMSAIPGVQ